MDHIGIYKKLIMKRLVNPVPNGVYTERHHIVPSSEGGSDDKGNIIRLTAREHYVAHLLLAKIYDDYAMHCAVIYMQCKSKTQNRNFRFNSRLYSSMRKEFSKKISGDNNWTRRHPEKVRRGFKYSAEHNRKLSEIGKTKIGKLNSFYGKHHSEETRKKISEKRKGVPNIAVSLRLKGTKLSEEHKQKDREAMLGMKYWNNGIKNVRARKCPPGFVHGRMKRKKQ